MFPEDMMNPMQKGGWIEVICGSMFSGKTEELIRRLKRAQFARLRVKIFKPAVDNRYDTDQVVSHDRNKISAIPVKSSDRILSLVSETDVVGIDEAQFFDEGIVDVCNRLANEGVRVIVAGLDMDFLGRPFGPMPQLMAIAEYVTKVHAICVRTGGLAHYTHRKVIQDDVVMVGGEEVYEPLSRAAFCEVMKKERELLIPRKEDSEKP